MTPGWKFVAVLLFMLAGFGAGWTANGWRLKAEISELKTARANEVAKQSQDALNDLTAATKHVKEAAEGYQSDTRRLDAKLDAIQKDVRNAKPFPLPADCKLDDVRLRRLTEAATAVNEAAFGLRLSAGLQAAPGS